MLSSKISEEQFKHLASGVAWGGGGGGKEYGFKVLAQFRRGEMGWSKNKTNLLGLH